MEAVLGLSVTPSAVGLVLVEGQDGDGATMDRHAFEILPGRASSAQQTSDQAAAAVLRTEEIAATRGHRLHSIGVTWSDDADAEAALLLKSLSDSGFDNVVPVRLPEATEALVWGVAEVIGHDITAVCVIEPEKVIALIVHTREGAVQTAINHAITTQEALIGWLSAVFTRADWRPEALVVVGTGGNFGALMPRLEGALSVPVFAPAEAELALARGAALASASDNDFFTDHIDHADEPHPRDRRRPAQAGPLAMLAAGAVTFVVSVSAAVSLQIAPDRDTAAQPGPAAGMSRAGAVNPVPPAVSPPAAIPVPIADTPLAPPPEAPPVEVTPPVELPAEPAPIGTPAVEAPALPAPVAAPIEALPPAAPPMPAPPPPEQVAPPVAPVPAERPGLLARIRDRLSGIGRDEVQQAPAPIPPPIVPPPGMPPAPPPA